MLEFFPESHEYRWCGRPVKSVTQIIDECDPIYKCADVQRGAEFGGHLHEAIRLHELGMLGSIDPAMEPFFESYILFNKAYPNTAVAEFPGTGKAVEVPMYSKLYDYAGTIDQLRVYKDRKGFLLPDWKSGAYSEKWHVQSAAYVQLVREWFGIPNTVPVERVPVRLTANMFVPCRSKNTWEADFNKFLRYKAQCERTKPDVCL